MMCLRVIFCTLLDFGSFFSSPGFLMASLSFFFWVHLPCTTSRSLSRSVFVGLVAHGFIPVSARRDRATFETPVSVRGQEFLPRRTSVVLYREVIRVLFWAFFLRPCLTRPPLRRQQPRPAFPPSLSLLRGSTRTTSRLYFP